MLKGAELKKPISDFDDLVERRSDFMEQYKSGAKKIKPSDKPLKVWKDPGEVDANNFYGFDIYE